MAKINSDGKITIETTNSGDFRFLQSTLHFLNIAFIIRNLSEDRTSKVILWGIPTDITEQELIDDLKCRGFNVGLVKWFYSKDKWPTNNLKKLQPIT